MQMESETRIFPDDGQSDCPIREQDYQQGIQEAYKDGYRAIEECTIADLIKDAEEKRLQVKHEELANAVGVKKYSSLENIAKSKASLTDHATDFYGGYTRVLQKMLDRSLGYEGYVSTFDCVMNRAHQDDFIGQSMRWNLSTAYRQQPAFALAGAMSLLGAITGRKIRDQANTRTNVYFVCVGEPGTGKDHARRCNETILAAADGCKHLAPEEMTSDSSLSRTLAECPARLFQPDEIGRWLATADAKRSPHHFALVSLLLKLYSSATSRAFSPKAYADPKYNVQIDQPHLALFATSTPQALYGSLGAESITDGLLSRLSVIQGDDQAPRQRQIQVTDPPEPIVNFTKNWVEFTTTGNLSAEHPEPIVVTSDSSVEDEFEEFGDWCDERAERSSVQSVWRRAEQKARQFALCFAASENEPPAVELSFDNARSGISLSRAHTMDLERIAADRLAASPFQSMCQDIYRFIDERDSCTMTELCRGLRKYSKKDRYAAIDQLQEERRIVVSRQDQTLKLEIKR